MPKIGQEYRAATEDGPYTPVNPGKGTHIWNGTRYIKKDKHETFELVIDGIVTAVGFIAMFAFLLFMITAFGGGAV